MADPTTTHQDLPENDPTPTRWDLPEKEEKEAKSFTAAADRLIKATTLVGFAAVIWTLAGSEGAPSWASIILCLVSVILVLAAAPLLFFWCVQVAFGLTSKWITWQNRRDWKFWAAVVLACIFAGIFAFSLSAAVAVSLGSG